MVSSFVRLFINALKFLPITLIYYLKGRTTHFYLILPILGIMTAIKKRNIPKLLWPIVLMYFISLLFGLFHFDLYMIKRSVIMIATPLFAYFLFEFYTKEELFKLVSGTLFICVLYFLAEMFFFGHTYKQISYGAFSFAIPKFNGIQGFSNHTGFTLVTLGCFFLWQKRWFYYFLTWVGLFLVVSRGSMLIGIVFFLLYLLQKRRKLLLVINTFLFSLLAFSPLVLLTIEYFCSNSFKLILNSISSVRYFLQLTFIKMFFDYPFGVGIDSSQNLFLKYINQSTSIVSEGHYTPPDMALQSSHSTFVNILVEQGIIGYILFLLFLFFLYSKIYKKAPLLCSLFVAHLIGHATLNGIAEFSFWLVVAFILIEDKSEEVLLC